MPTSSLIKAVTTGAMLWAPLALASGSSHVLLTDRLSADTSCAGAADAKKSAKLHKCVPGAGKPSTRIFETLKPVDSKLPDTARRDATAGVFI